MKKKGRDRRTSEPMGQSANMEADHFGEGGEVTGRRRMKNGSGRVVSAKPPL